MIILLALSLSLIMLAVIVLYLAWVMDGLFGEEDYVTSKEGVQQIAKIIEGSECRNGTLYDLGSCRGTFCFHILKLCPHLKVVGIDKSVLRTLFARLQKIFHGNAKSLTFLVDDIFKTDVSKIDWAFVYLPRPMLRDLEAKLQRELKIGAQVITYRVNLPSWQHTKVFPTDFQNGVSQNNIFIYQKT